MQGIKVVNGKGFTGGDYYTQTEKFYLSQVYGPLQFYLKISGLITRSFDSYDMERSGSFNATKPPTKSARRAFANFVTVFLWVWIFRTALASMFSDPHVLATYFGDMTSANDGSQLFLDVAIFGFGINAALISLHFYQNELKIDWLEKYTRLWNETSFRIGWSGSRPSNNYTRYKMWHRRINFLVMVISGVNLVCFSGYNFYIAANNPVVDMYLFMPFGLMTALWIFWCFSSILSSVGYFFLTCISLKQRYEEVNEDLERLDADMKPTNTLNIDGMSKLQVKHYSACEMLHELNRFWSKYMFYSYIVQLPLTCFFVYQAIFAKVGLPMRFALSWFAFLSFLFISCISLVAATIASEAHRPYTLLYTMSLAEMPIDMRIQMSTFLQRLGGPTIGVMCLDLFVITDGKISSVCTAVLSYFFIIVDFHSSEEEDEAGGTAGETGTEGASSGGAAIPSGLHHRRHGAHHHTGNSSTALPLPTMASKLLENASNALTTISPVINRAARAVQLGMNDSSEAPPGDKLHHD